MESRANATLKSENIKNFSNNRQALLFLQRDRADYFVTELNIGKEEAKNYSDIYNVGTVEKIDIYTYLHKKHIGLIHRIEQGIKSLKKSGRLKEIEQKHKKSVK
ncbi:transporter substrate-binding domain-containing protein [Halobacteriovorax sp. JY17]|uniref:transporter substrate-binding domain-containing protein n=1 Tax=Halobacteriovorax sp. JY17 TaxID=2014617 RepID=UPI000C41598C|nr:MAG: hypothetical protein CES88_12340 [Halobacteriovorax sp. JY17]